MTHNLYRFPYWPFNVIKLINFFLDFFSGSCRKRTTSRYCCIFPFIYKGRRYNRCTRKNHNRPWCAITPNYDRDRKWGNCAGKSGFFCLFFHVFATSVSFSVMRETRVRFHTIALNITGCSILARSAKRASMCYGKETEPCLTFLCTTFQTGPFEFLRL